MAEDELRLLRERVASLEAELASLQPQGIVMRQRIDEMSAEVVDTNPYSRLMALKRMGIVDDYQVYIVGSQIKFIIPFYRESEVLLWQ